MQTQRTLVACLAALGLTVASGCESMESPGHPFSPAAVDQIELVAGPTDSQRVTTEEPWVSDPTWTDPEPFAITSEQMLGATPAVADADPSTEPEAASDPEPVSAVVEASPAAPPAAPPAVAAATPSMMSGWPLRLVKTIPEAMPPRAILGLPDGREVVVSPGSLVSDQGVVVISIARDHVELAKVEARGDHASISALTLHAQY